MEIALPLEQMTVAEKLSAMEMLWADLSRIAPDEITPEWHRPILEARERDLASGKETVLDWEDAKRRIMEELHDRQNP